MDISRRSFLRGALTVAAASIVSLPAIAAKPDIPVLYGNGFHDDAAALNALFRGDPVICENSRIAFSGGPGEEVRLFNGIFSIGDTVRVRSDWVSIDHVLFRAMPDLTGPMLEMHARRASVTQCSFLGNGKCGGIALRQTASECRIVGCVTTNAARGIEAFHSEGIASMA